MGWGGAYNPADNVGAFANHHKSRAVMRAVHVKGWCMHKSNACTKVLYAQDPIDVLERPYTVGGVGVTPPRPPFPPV